MGFAMGWAAVAAYAVLLIVATTDALQARASVERRAAPPSAAERFVEVWERSRLGTYVASGTFERSSSITGARVASQDIVAQLPPRRLHRQLGGVDGRNDDRPIFCPAPAVGVTGPSGCRLGEPGGPTFSESVATEVASLRAMVTGPASLYTVAEISAGCFALKQIRVETRAPFGIRARFCFDPLTGARSASRVEYGRGIVEVVAVTSIRADVQEADLQP